MLPSAQRTTSMFPKSLILTAGVWALGLGLGFAVKRALLETPNAPPASRVVREEAAAPPRSTSRPASPRTGRGRAAELLAAAAGMRSNDTLESILEITDYDEEYGRLALWMAEAGAADIESFWRQKSEVSNDIKDLIFINWTRADPLGATTSAEGTNDEHYAWWAWGCHEPQRALAEAIARRPERVQNVTWAIGEFHSGWMMEHWDEIPEEGRNNALMAIVKWDDAPDPGAVLDFLEAQGRGDDSRMFQALVRKDPWAAYDRLRARGEVESSRYGSNSSMNAFLSAMSASHPDLLERMAQETPPGELRRKMEAAAFEGVLARDPELAVAEALASPSPLVRAERLAKAGHAIIEENPDQAFALAKELFALDKDILEGRTSIYYENGRSSSGGSGTAEFRQMVGALLNVDPDRTLAMAVDEGEPAPPFRLVAEQWARQDLMGFGEWIGQEEDAKVVGEATGIMVGQLQEAQLHADAVDWAMSHPDTRKRLDSVFYSWTRQDLAGARSWLEGAELTGDERERLEDYLERQ